jgi:hypothetical protein
VISSGLLHGGTIPAVEQPGRVITPSSPVVWDEEEIESFEGVDGDDGEWYAIRTDPWPCPACQVEFEYVTGAHHVIVAPERDDLLQIAAACQKVKRNARIVHYDDNLPCMTLFQWQALGRPVHGMKKV